MEPPSGNGLFWSWIANVTSVVKLLRFVAFAFMMALTSEESTGALVRNACKYEVFSPPQAAINLTPMPKSALVIEIGVDKDKDEHYR